MRDASYSDARDNDDLLARNRDHEPAPTNDVGSTPESDPSDADVGNISPKAEREHNEQPRGQSRDQSRMPDSSPDPRRWPLLHALRLGQRLRQACLAHNPAPSEVAQRPFTVANISAVERGQIRPCLGALEMPPERLAAPFSDLAHDTSRHACLNSPMRRGWPPTLLLPE